MVVLSFWHHAPELLKSQMEARKRDLLLLLLLLLLLFVVVVVFVVNA